MAASSWSLSDESWRWNEYIIEEQVGGDQWSKLHKAREVLTNKIIAVKIFGRFCIPAKDRSHVRAIENEVEMLGAAKNGPHIIKAGSVRNLKDMSRNVELPMEFYAGDLFSLISDCPHQHRGLVNGYIVIPPWYNTVLISMLEALEFLHSEKIGIIHRDVKPENIFYNDINSFVLGNFRHACRRHSPPHGRSDSLEFMAPEMYDEDGKQTTAVDMWSLGVVCLEMLGCMPKVSHERTFEHMKARNWCGLLEEIADELGKREIATMVQLDPFQRPPASDVLTFLSLSNSSLLTRQKANERLICLLLEQMRWSQGWSEEVVRSASAEYFSKYAQGLSSTLVGEIPEGHIPETTPEGVPTIDSVPSLTLNRKRQRLKSQGPSMLLPRSTLKPASMVTRRIMGPGNSTGLSTLSSSSSGLTVSSSPESSSPAEQLNLARTLPPALSQGTRKTPTTTATPQPWQSQQSQELSPVAPTETASYRSRSTQTPKWPLGATSVQTQTKIQKVKEVETQTPIQHSRTIGTLSQRTAETQTEGLLPQMQRSSRTVETQTEPPLQQVERSSRTVETQTERPLQQIERSSSAPAISSRTMSEAIAGSSSSTSRGSLMPATLAKRQRRGSPRAENVRARQASSSVEASSTTTPPAPTTTNDRTSTSSVSPLMTSSGTGQARQRPQTRNGKGEIPSRPLSIHAREYYPLDHPRSEHRQLPQIEDTQPIRQLQGQVEQEGTLVRQPMHQPESRGHQERNQSRRRPSQSSSHPRAQNQAAMVQVGMCPPISPFMVSPIVPVWIRTGMAQSPNPFLPGAPPFPPADLSGLLDPWNPRYGIGQPNIPPNPTLLGNLSSPSFPSPRDRPHGATGGQPSRQRDQRDASTQARPEAARQHSTGPTQSPRQHSEAQGGQAPRHTQARGQQRGAQGRQVPPHGESQAQESFNQRPEAQSQQREPPGRNPSPTTPRTQAEEIRPSPPPVPRIPAQQDIPRPPATPSTPAQQDRPTGSPPHSHPQRPQNQRSPTSTGASLPPRSAEAQQTQQGRVIVASSRPSLPRNAEAQNGQQRGPSSSSSRPPPASGAQAQPQAETRRDKTPARQSPPRRPTQDTPAEEKKEPDPEAGWEQPRHLRRRERRLASKGSGSGSRPGSGKI